MKKELVSIEEYWKMRGDLEKNLKKNGIKGKKLMKFYELGWLMYKYDKNDDDKVVDCSFIKKLDLLLKIWIVQKEILWNLEMINENVFDYLDMEDDDDEGIYWHIVELKDLKKERRKLFEERNNLEALLNEDEVVMKLLKYLSK